MASASAKAPSRSEGSVGKPIQYRRKSRSRDGEEVDDPSVLADSPFNQDPCASSGVATLMTPACGQGAAPLKGGEREGLLLLHRDGETGEREAEVHK
jgi:hypothetical protein